MAVHLPLHLSPGEHVVVDEKVATFLEPYLRSGFRLLRGYAGLRRPFIYQPMRTGKQQPLIRLARWVMRAKADQFPQHHDGDVLNCLRSNLYLDGSRGRAFWERRYSEK